MTEAPEEARRLHPATLAVRALEQLPQLVLGIPAAAYFVGNVEIGVALVLAVAGLLFAALFAYLYWLRFRYQIIDSQLIIESGVISRNRRTIPFDRIQDISLEQKLLARIFGVSVVRIETGGSGGDEGELECVSREEADRLRDIVRRHRARAAGEAVGDDQNEAPAPVLFHMEPVRLLIAGLFNFSLVFLAIVGAVWQYLGSYLPIRYLDPEYYFDIWGEAIGRWSGWLLELAPIIGLFAALATLLVVGVVTGVVRTVLRDFGFVLTRTETGFRRVRGLFTRTDVVMPLKRVQAAVVSTGIIQRRFGWQGLALQSLGTDGDAGTNHAAAPFATRAELLPILEEIALPAPPPSDEFRSVSRHFIVHGWIVMALLLLVLAALASAFWPAGLWSGLVAPLLFLIPPLQYRAHGYMVAGKHLLVRSGVWKPRTVILERNKVQSATVVRTPLQRLLGTATLVIGTAGAPLAAPLKIVDLDQARAIALIDELLADALRGQPAP